MTTPAALRWAPRTTGHTLGRATVTVLDRDRTRPFLLLHGGAGPMSVRGFGDLMASRLHARVLMPTHPGFDGTPRPPGLATVAGLAALYAELLERLDVWDVTVIGNSIGGWAAAELALLGSPRVSGAVLVNAVGIEVPGHPVSTDLSPSNVFFEPGRFPPGPPPDLAPLSAYTGMTMADPTLRARLGELDLPVHVVWGAADGIVDVAYGEAYAAAIPGARFSVIERAGHLPQIETPEELLGVIT